MKKKFINSLLNKNTPKGFTPLGFLVRVFLYSGVLITLILPSLNEFKTQSFSNTPETEGANNLEKINRTQQAYLLEIGHFSDSLSELPIQFMQSSYTFQIISPMIPAVHITNNSNSSKSLQSVFTIAQPLPDYSHSFKSYIGAVFFETNKGIAVAGICQMNAVKTLPTTVPILNSDKTIQCPPGSTLLR